MIFCFCCFFIITGRKARFFAEKTGVFSPAPTGRAAAIRLATDFPGCKPQGKLRMNYAYRHRQTIGTTGFFACEPEGDLSFGKLLNLLESSGGDTFLRKHLLQELEKLRPRQLLALAGPARKAVRKNLASLLLEYAVLKGSGCVLSASLSDLEKACACPPPAYLAQRHYPQSLLASLRVYGRHFEENIRKHHKIPMPVDVEAAKLFARPEVCQAQKAMLANADKLAALHRQRLPATNGDAEADLSEILRKALLALEGTNILAGPEMRHEKSLSPIGLLREWHLSASSIDGAQKSELSGIATAYGRGLSIPAARTSLAMEIVERASAHVKICFAKGSGEVLGRKEPMPLVEYSLGELVAENRAHAFPRPDFPPEIWKHAKLKWVRGRDRNDKEVLVPAQAVFLFCNLDEPELFGTTGSTGLASGTSREFARLSALVEVIERDAAATTPHYAESCFCVKSRDKRVQALLDDYAAQGIVVQFQDITTEIGLPACRCFVIGRDGTIFQAAAASPSGKKAALAALTETPWEYAFGRRPGKASMPQIRRLPRIYLEDLPDYDLGAVAANLKLVEDALLGHGLEPVYVDLTRSDLDLPVCRAIVPGLEVAADFDNFNLPSARLLARQKILFESNLPIREDV